MGVKEHDGMQIYCTGLIVALQGNVAVDDLVFEIVYEGCVGGIIREVFVFERIGLDVIELGGEVLPIDVAVLFVADHPPEGVAPDMGGLCKVLPRESGVVEKGDGAAPVHVGGNGKVGELGKGGIKID